MPPKSAKDVKTDAYKKVSVGTYSNGQPVLINKRTQAMLRLAEEKLGYPLTITQGSYHPGFGPSGGTHDGGGVVDLLAFEAERKVKALREVGFAAWRRLPSEGPWPEHVHAVAMGDLTLSPEAKSQVADYKKGLNGLANHASDPIAKPRPMPKNFNYAVFIGAEGTPSQRRNPMANRKPKPKSRTPHQDAVESAALEGLAAADSPTLTRFFAEILEQARRGPEPARKRKSEELMFRPDPKGEAHEVPDDDTAATPAAAPARRPAKKAAKKAAKRSR